MGKLIDLTGERFGKLTVLHRVQNRVQPSGQSKSQWMCLCDCGNQIIVAGQNLRNNHTLSCGCLISEKASTVSKKYNNYKIINNIVYIYFNDNDEYTMVNLDKWDEIPYIKEFCWCKDGYGYAYAHIPIALRDKFKKKHIKLHQLICPCEYGYEPDHLDRNKLNNLTNNLIPKTRMRNMRNVGLRNCNTSGYIGVTWDKSKKKWYSYIEVYYKRMNLGHFEHKNDAIKARLQAEADYFGTDAPQQHLFEQYGITSHKANQQNNTTKVKEII